MDKGTPIEKPRPTYYELEATRIIELMFDARMLRTGITKTELENLRKLLTFYLESLAGLIMEIKQN